MACHWLAYHPVDCCLYRNSASRVKLCYSLARSAPTFLLRRPAAGRPPRVKMASASAGNVAAGDVANLDSSDADVRKATLYELGRTLGTEALAVHGPLIAQRTRDDKPDVREAAVECLAKLAPAELGSFAMSLVSRLDDSVDAVRKAAVDALVKLEPHALTAHASAVVSRLEMQETPEGEGSASWGSREAAITVLLNLEPAALAPHAARIAKQLDDPEWMMRRTALDVLGRLAPNDLALQAPALARRMGDADEDVRKAAVETLAKLAPTDLAPHALALAKLLEEAPEWYLRQRAAEAIGMLEPEQIAIVGRELLRATEDPNEHVREAAESCLLKLEPDVIEAMAG